MKWVADVGFQEKKAPIAMTKTDRQKAVLEMPSRNNNEKYLK